MTSWFEDKHTYEHALDKLTSALIVLTQLLDVYTYSTYNTRASMKDSFGPTTPLMLQGVNWHLTSALRHSPFQDRQQWFGVQAIVLPT